MDPESTSASWHIPHISISPAPPEEMAIEPFSPLSSMPAASNDDDADPVESRHLTPLPTSTTSGFNQILRPLGNIYDADGMRQKRSKALFQASTERSIPISVIKTSSLRKNIASNTNTQGIILPLSTSFWLTIIDFSGSASACSISL